MRKQNWLFIVLILAIIVTAYFIVQSVRDSAQQAVNPIRQANNSLQTQVSNLLHPTPTIIPDPSTNIHEVRALARLETIQYSVEKVITAETGQDIFKALLGDRLLLVAHGVVIAGIDMQKMNPQDLQLQDGSLFVRLPQAEIFVATLDNQKTYVYDRQTGIFRSPDQNLETLARQSAENEIRKAALDDGILEQAQTNAEIYLERFFQALGYQQVTFIH
jgi:hypothetical protein